MMTNGPNARIGKVMEVDLPRPRSRKELLNHPDYYSYRQELLDFLEEYEGGAAGKTSTERKSEPAESRDEAA
jgi:nitrate/nitrite transport system ATP-binding protein